MLFQYIIENLKAYFYFIDSNTAKSASHSALEKSEFPDLTSLAITSGASRLSYPHPNPETNQHPDMSLSVIDYNTSTHKGP